jgi:tetratricopeptide (TPR) repeat protein
VRSSPVIIALLVLAAQAGPGCTRRREAPSAAVPAAPEADRLEREGRWLEAAALHRREALALAAGAPDEPVKLAIAAYLMAGRLDEAERFAGDVLAREPGRHDVLFYLGDGQRVLMRHEDALGTLSRLLERDPAHARGTLALAGVLARLGKAAEAVPLYERFLGMPEATGSPRQAAELELARALRRLGRHAEAAGRLAAILEANPHDPAALAEAAQTFAALGKHDIARALREEHAWLFARGHQLSGEDESKIYATGARGAAGEARRALQAADRRELLSAIEALERIHQSAPGDREIGAALARLLLRLERAADALAAARAALAAPGGADAGLLVLEADALLSLGRRAEARESLGRASAMLAGGAREDALPEDAVEIHLRAGREELEPDGDVAAAAACFERAERAAPSDWRPLEGRARVEIARGNIRTALGLLEAAAGRGGREALDVRRSTAVARGLAGELRIAAREIMALIAEDRRDLDSFRAFERVFASRASEPEVARVLEMKAALEGKRDAREALARRISSTPLRQCGPLYLEIARLALEAGDRERALDALFLAADLEPGRTEALELAANLLARPRDAFRRLHALRRILERSTSSAGALEGLVRLHLHLGVRLDAAESLASRLVEAAPGEASARLLSAVRERRAEGSGPPPR